jgi:hypothetical protein
MNFILELIIAGSLLSHPVHIAFTNIDIEPEEVTVAHKVILNDFDLLFFHLFEKDLQPRQDIEFKNEEIALIGGYMKERFILVADNDTLPLKYVKKSQDNEYLWLYYSAKINPGIKEIQINNMLLLDINMDQKNLVIVNYGKTEKGFSFDWDNRQTVLSLRE